MIINYGLNPDNTFNFWQVYPIEERLPTLEVEDPQVITLGKTKLINGEIVQPVEDDEEVIRKNRDLFYMFRKKMFQALDVFEKNVLMGREQRDDTISVNWYNQMLNFPKTINKNTTRADYPEIPSKIRYYL